MTIEKIPDKRIDKTWLDSVCAAKINEIIDHLKSKDHIVEKHEIVGKDWIDYLWERHFKDDARRERQGLRNQIESAMNMCPPKVSRRAVNSRIHRWWDYMSALYTPHI